MTRGDIVKLAGYELCAAIDYVGADACAVVVHNNSSHFLVIAVDGRWNGKDDMTLIWGRFIRSYRYDERPESPKMAYRWALTYAMDMAIGEESDE